MSAMACVRTDSVAFGVLILPGIDRARDVVREKDYDVATEGTL